MEKTEWLVFTCRACRGVIKLSSGMMTAKHVICPSCRTKVSVPKDATVIQEEAAHNPIPASRSNDEMMSQLRGKGREEWEIGNRPTGGDLPFRERLHNTSIPKLQTDAPDQPEVHRVNLKRRKLDRTHPDFDDPENATRRRSSRRKLRSSGQAFNQTFVRGLVIAVVILAGVAAWLGWKQFPQLFRDPSSSSSSSSPPPPDQSKLEMRSMADYGPALRDAVRRFVSAPNIDAMLPLVRDRERVEPKIRAWYTAEKPWKPIEINNKFDPSDVFTVDGDFIVLQLILANFDEMPISLERNGKDFLVDWESFTGYGEMTWDELMEKRPQQPVLMRAVIERSRTTDYFNDAFSNPQTHNCYLVRDADSEHIISGYTVKDSAPDVKLRQHLQRLPDPSDKFRTLAVITLRYPANSKGPHQVEIVEFLENGWVFRPDKK